eukprot:TRINITY_DN8819_c0_g1_i1.p1 TRINITY_DN8819_c0_g1~~TRINITY_DN8819_c0_g1_i1.p1  ORF type:complete len:215 (-),score=20.44 TRINITY_DN8819_c0_g1_i1:10-654(-)
MLSLPGEGESFLHLLFECLGNEKYEKRLRSGEILLLISPNCLRYMNTRLKGMNYIPVEGRKTLTRADLLDLQYCLEQVKRLRIALKDTISEANIEVDISYFTSLEELEIENVKASLLLHANKWSNRLKLFSIEQSINSVSEVLLLPKLNLTGSEPSQYWRNLKELSCSLNNIMELDSSLSLLTTVERIDLSYNRISKIQNLVNCYQLELSLIHI